MWHPRAESFIRDLTLKNKFQELDQLDLHFLAWHAASVQIKPCWCKLNHGSAAARPISRYRFIQTLILVNSFGKNLTFQNSCHVFFRLQSRITATVIGVFIQLFCFFNMCVFFFYLFTGTIAHWSACVNAPVFAKCLIFMLFLDQMLNICIHSKTDGNVKPKQEK